MSPRAVVLFGCLALIPVPVFGEALHRDEAPFLAIHAECIRGLRNAGYRQIRMLQWETNRFSAYDAQGSEIVLVLDPATGGIASQEYVHPSDR